MSDLLLPDGSPIRMGYVPPHERGEPMRFAAVPAFDEANEVLSESQWEENDDAAMYNSPIKSQKYSNCTNASLASMIELDLRSSGIDAPDLSWSFLWAHFNGGSPNSGAMCREVIAKAKEVGIPRADLWPESNYAISRGEVSQAILDDAALYRPLEVYQCMDWRDICSALTRRFRVYFGLCLGGKFFNTPKNGVAPAWDGGRSNGHAMFARGLRKVSGVWHAVVPNTWGTSFGENGVSYMDASYFWAKSGNFYNLDAYAVRCIKAAKPADWPKAG